MDDLPNVIAPEVFTAFGISFTNTMLSGFLVTLAVALFCIAIVFNTKREGVPSRFQIICEAIYLFTYNTIFGIVREEKLTKRILPIIGAVFIYIGLSNVMLIIPGFEALNYNNVQVFRVHTSDFNTTFGIATAMVLWTQVFSILKNNPFGHIDKFFNFTGIVKGFRNGIGSGMISIIEAFVGLLDIVSEIAKIISLSARLFGNMFAGLMLNALLFGTIALVAPVLLIIYGIFSGLIQALVFAALSSSYFGMAVEPEQKT